MSVSYSDCFSDLLCGEDSDTVFSNGRGEDLPECSSSDIESQFADIDESIAGLIEDEQNFVPGFDYIEKFQSQSLSAAARDESVAWILKVLFIDSTVNSGDRRMLDFYYFYLLKYTCRLHYALLVHN